jgi:NADPH:quinone reductase-like Zn-dependent oxidoreductase
MPKTMRAAAIDRFGDPDVLTIHELPVPEPGPTEVLIAVHTAGVATWDAQMRGGWWPEKKRPPFPLILGTDGSGTIAAVGSRVRRFAPGDRVYAYSFSNRKGGFYAEYVVVEAENVAAAPEVLNLKKAGAVAAIGLTAQQGIEDVLKVKRGEAVVIHGASGGLGTLAVQFAKARGARVMATASGNDGMSVVRRVGADAVADGRRDDLKAAAEAFAPKGVDAVLAFAGGKSLTRLLDALRPGGRLVYPNGVEPAPRKRRGLNVESYDATPGVRALDRLGKAIAKARAEVRITDEFPLEQAAKAHARVEQGHVLGKIVLRIRMR